MCAFSARAARDELIKWWINLARKMGEKRSKIRKNINDERKTFAVSRGNEEDFGKHFASM